MSPLILTFTGNPLAETTFDAPGWRPGRTQRARSASFQMGGKGINVSKMLRRLGARTRVLSFLGGNSGADCRDWLAARGFDFSEITTRHSTRTGLVVRDPGAAETTFLGTDTPPDAQAWQQAARCLADFKAPETALAFCGSCPGWDDPAAACFRESIGTWIHEGLPLFVDTYGPPLAWFVTHPVELVKINADELRGLLGTGAPQSVEEGLHLALARWPVRNWIISDGPGPVWHASALSRPACQVPPKVKEVSATGCGDVLLACLIHARLNLGLGWSEALAFGLPQAAANAAHPGIAEF